VVADGATVGAVVADGATVAWTVGISATVAEVVVDVFAAPQPETTITNTTSTIALL
jgi:hypothetical protein